ncbi:MAG: Imm10 family immunity protein [Pyrinomonadaceae bacterium]
MIIEFDAEGVEVILSSWGIITISFYAEENYLTIQQPVDKTEGMNVPPAPNSYHIERDDQSYGEYGGVESVTLSRDSIAVVLDSIGQEHLQCESVIARFETDDETYRSLTEKLEYIFGDSFTVTG